MSGRGAGPKSAESRTDWESLKSASDVGVDVSDIPRLQAGFWRTAQVRMPHSKDSVTLRVDHDVLQWFKRRGKGYQTRINAVLRSYMEHASKA